MNMKPNSTPVVARIGGRAYAATPLTDRDFRELHRWVNRNLPDMREAARSIIEGVATSPEGAGEPLGLEALRAILDADPGSVSIDSPASIAALRAVEGRAYALYLSLRHGRPDVFLADVRAAVASMTVDDYAPLEECIWRHAMAAGTPPPNHIQG